MKELISKIYSKLGIKSQRTQGITKHVLLSFIYRGGSIASSFLLVPLTINYLDTENYGIWLTLSSFIGWFAFFDIGLGHGLRNKFSESKAQDKLELAQAYVSTAYFTIGSICLGLIFLFLGLNSFVDWTVVFNTDRSLQTQLSILMPVVFSFFCLQMVVTLITTIYIADQKPSVQGKVGFFTQVSSLIFIYLLTQTNESSLLIFGTIFSALPVIILLFLNFFAFSKTYKDFKPKFSLWKKIYLKDIFGLGFKFFIIQMCGIILFSTDNLIISNIFNPEKVVPYNIAFKYFSVANMVASIILMPYWSSISEAFTKGEYDWIKKSMNSLIKITFGLIGLLFVMLIVSPIVYKIWIGDSVIISFTLSIFMALYFAVTIFYGPYTYFINGTGKVTIQLYSLLATAIINIPLSIFLAKNLNLGVTGVILATIICLIPHVILSPLQYLKIINHRAYGIWNK
ncbi:lipopolysaccharide biosynthesis protein [Lutibacter sp. HS1-25]|uniref:lipopolysaccharide biosynthesis protein n=1 Tax=Lutibacter sp. HS1-25 TaxID=2485000 RepID=UPI00101355B0|nr:MATE family efflux transporter [Lutibacter sp. HS1-25]